MNTFEIYNNEIEKIKLTINKPKSDDSILCTLLFRDYLTKLFIWKKKLGNDSEFIKHKESHNLFLELNPNFDNRLKSLDEFKNDLKNAGIKTNGGRFFDDIFIYLIVYWNIFKDYDEIKNKNLLSPYDPISKLLERTKYIYIHNGSFEIGNFTFTSIEKYNDFSLPSLEDDFLEFLERKYTQKIPNQKEINILWKELIIKTNSKKKHIN